MTVSRRSALAWFAASSGVAALAACAEPVPPGDQATRPGPAEPAPAAPRPTPAPTSPAPVEDVAPDLAAIEARFRDAVPREWGLHVTGVVNRAPEGSSGSR